MPYLDLCSYTKPKSSDGEAEEKVSLSSLDSYASQVANCNVGFLSNYFIFLWQKPTYIYCAMIDLQ